MSIEQYVLAEAAKSNVEKRKVGCVLVDSKNNIIGKGYNTDSTHAEINAIQDYQTRDERAKGPITAWVSQPPCPECAEALLRMQVKDIKVVEEFIKFDGDKLRYDLIPPSATYALASVLTTGARKYKPNNWKQCKDLGRYVSATMRHFEAYRAGEFDDSESGMPHLWHALTNIVFLIELDGEYNA